jgi:hypothetical protein
MGRIVCEKKENTIGGMKDIYKKCIDKRSGMIKNLPNFLKAGEVFKLFPSLGLKPLSLDSEAKPKKEP